MERKSQDRKKRYREKHHLELREWFTKKKTGTKGCKFNCEGGGGRVKSGHGEGSGESKLNNGKAAVVTL